MKIVPLRGSERSTFKRCPQRWWWGFRQGLRPQGLPNQKLWFGQGVHLALALWYPPGRKRGVDPRQTWRTFVADDIQFIKAEFAREYDVAEFIEAGEFGEQLLDEYLQYWGNDDSIEMIAPEQTFELTIPDENGKPLCILYGTFDGVYRDLDNRRIVKLLENKTAKQISTGHLELDDQAGGYHLAATYVLRAQGLIKPKEEIVEITYNFLRKGTADGRPVNEQGQSLNKDGSISKVQPKPLFERFPVERSRNEHVRQLEKIRAEVRAMNKYRSGELELFKTGTRDCSWDCEFYQMCLLDESNPDDVPEFRNAVFRVQDPYAAHRKSAAE
jgi:Zierdtviridae exonuclease